MKKIFEEKIFSNNKRTLAFIGSFLVLVLFFYQIILLLSGKYYNMDSDDVFQYSPILGQYLELIKNGELGFFNFNNNIGGSVFQDAYYVPLDIFTLINFVLNLFMNHILAFSLVSLLKIVLGVLVFAFFLQKKGVRNSIVVMISFMYFCTGGSFAFSVFPTYFSMFFYLPLSLLVIYYYCNEKKWIMPIYSFLLVLYNFYNAYTLFIFMLFVFVVCKIRDNYEGIKELIKDIFVFGMHIVLGVGISLFVLIPSITYIVSNSIRNEKEFIFLFDINTYLRMIYKLFIYEPSSVSLATILNAGGGYVTNHYSLYIGFFGLYIVSLIFFMKDKTSKIYKWTFLVIAVFMIFPIFSMFFSGVGVPYTRWLSFLNIIFLCFMSHVLSNLDFHIITKNTKIILTSCILGLYISIIVYNIINMKFRNGYNDLLYSEYCLTMLSVFLIILVLYVVFNFTNQKGLIYVSFSVEMIISMMMNFIDPLIASNSMEIIDKQEEVKEVLSLLKFDNDLERVYVGNVLGSNNSRFINRSVNESTFHSFVSKYIYDIENLYDNDDESLVVDNVNRYDPNYSRLVDYKYVVLKKSVADKYRINHLSLFKEIGDYLVYVNENYEPFYVYEDYYDYDEVVSLNDKDDLLSYEKKLFEGVVLESNNFKLNKLDFNYDDSSTIKVDIWGNIDLTEQSKGLYFKEINFDSDAEIYFKSEDSSIESIRVINNGVTSYCKENNGIFSCYIHEGNTKIEVQGSKGELYYSLVENVNDKKFLTIDIEENINGKYMMYSTESRYNIYLKGVNGETRECLNGFCYIEDIEVDKIYVYGDENIIYSDKSLDFMYSLDDLSYYNLKCLDSFASEKSLSYNKSAVNVKYKRNSNSSNDQVIVLPISYSDEWKINDPNYTLVRANGGYLGVVVKNGIKDIDITINFKPKGLTIGAIGSIISIGVYAFYVIAINYKEKRENINEIIKDEKES